MSETLTIPPKRKTFYQALWSRWLIVLMIVFDLQRVRRGPVAVETVAAHLPIRDLKTVRGYLRDLSVRGLLAAVQPGRWLLTDTGVLVVERAAGWLAEADPEKDLPDFARGEIPPLIDDDDSISLIKDIESSSSSEGGNPPSETGKGAENTRILDATALLFADCGGAISTEGLGQALDYFEPEWVLQWIAKAWADRRTETRPRGLVNPQGLVYQRLRTLTIPPSVIVMQNPVSSLPDAYLDAIGRYSRTCDRCHAAFTSLKAYEEHERPCLFTQIPEEEEDDLEPLSPDETVRQLITETTTAEMAWASALDQLQREMPKASFDTWVRDTVAMHYEDGKFSIGVRNGFTRDWLESRLTSTVTRLLMGICDRDVCVEFMAAGEFAEDEEE
jgi:hypothetical protein